jgi:protein-tyrosine-phosphatase
MKKVLFICEDNSCRSLMAEAFVARFGKGVIEAESAGIAPAKEADRMATAVMRERGFAIGKITPKGLASPHDETIDLCVHFGCPEASLPVMPSLARRDWGDIVDPRGQAYSVYRKVREEIGVRVMGLIREMRDNS